MKLTCDICGGELEVLQGGKGAVCKGCSVTYTIERLREKLGVKELNTQKTDTTINNVVTDDIPVAKAYEASFISEDDTKTKEAPKKETSQKSAPKEDNTKKEKPKMKTITFKRKRDLFLCKVKVLIDDENEYILNGQGKETQIKVSQGIHKINVFVGSSAGIQELEEKTIEVGDYDYYGEIGLYRGAFKTAFGYTLIEVK